MEVESSEPQSESRPVRGAISTIAGGFAGGQTKSARRKHLKAIQAVMSVSHILPN